MVIPMKRKFWLWAFIIVFATFAMITYNSLTINKEATRIAEVQMVNDLSNASMAFTKWINAKIVMLETSKEIIGNTTFEDLSYTNIFNKYLEIGMDDELVTVAYIGLNDGAFLSGDGWTMPEGYDPRNRTWYIEAKESNSTIISRVYVDADTGDKTITISSPLYMEENFIGIIAVDIFITNLDKKLSEMEISEDAYAYLVSRDGMIIEHSKHNEWVGTSIYEIASLSDPDRFMEVFEKDFISLTYEIEGEEIFAVVRVIPDSGWFIGISSRTEDIFKNSYISTETLLLNCALFLLILMTIRMIYIYERLLIETNGSLETKNQELSEASDTINRINKQLDIKSKTDGLTQIYNRGSFDETMEDFWIKAEAQNHEVSMVLFDIDYFKKYNDHYGHVKGDEVLINLCELVSSILGPDDFFARYGGEEFVVIRYDNSMENAYELGERIVKAIYDANIEHLESYLERITVSVGVNATIPQNDVTIGRFIYNTDIAMYQAKEAGKNQVAKAVKDKDKT